MDELKDFDGLVSWATWHVIDGLTRGRPLRLLVSDVIEFARRWEPKTHKGKEPSNG